MVLFVLLGCGVVLLFGVGFGCCGVFLLCFGGVAWCFRVLMGCLYCGFTVVLPERCSCEFGCSMAFAWCFALLVAS